MNHLSDKQIEVLALGRTPGAEDPVWVEHVDTCRNCRERYVTLLLPSVRREVALSDTDKDRLFEGIVADSEAGGAKVLVFPRVLFRSAAGFALAAGLVLAVIRLADKPVTGPSVANVPTSAAVGSSEPVLLARIDGGVTVDGVVRAEPGILGPGDHSIELGSGQAATVGIGEAGRLSLGERTTVALAAADTVHAHLGSGRLEAEWNSKAGRLLFVSVPGGTYHVVGTIFGITVDGKGSTIDVTRGAVAFTPLGVSVAVDTVTAGQRRSYGADGSPVGPGAASYNGDRIAGRRSPHISTATALESSDEFLSGSRGSEDAGGGELTALQKARSLRQLGRPAEAIEVLRGALGAKRPPAEIYIGMGQSYEAMGVADSAYRYYGIAAGIRMPTEIRATAWRCIGNLARGVGDFDRSALAYRNYLDVDPRGGYRSEAFEELYRHHTRDGNLDKQIAVLMMWTAELPELDHPVYLLASAYHAKGDYRYALRYYETYIIKYPEGPEREASMYYAADCSRRLGEDDAYAGKALRYRKEFPNGRFADLVGRD